MATIIFTGLRLDFSRNYPDSGLEMWSLRLEIGNEHWSLVARLLRTRKNVYFYTSHLKCITAPGHNYYGWWKALSIKHNYRLFWVSDIMAYYSIFLESTVSIYFHRNNFTCVFTLPAPEELKRHTKLITYSHHLEVCDIFTETLPSACVFLLFCCAQVVWGVNLLALCV